MSPAREYGSIRRLFGQAFGSIPEGGCSIADEGQSLTAKEPSSFTLLLGKGLQPGTLTTQGGVRAPTLCARWEQSRGAHLPPT